MGSGTDIPESAKERAVSAAGGPARLQIIAVLAAILAVESSDLGTVSAISGELKGAFHLGNTDIGLLLAVVSFVSAAATLPLGALSEWLGGGQSGLMWTFLIMLVPMWSRASSGSGRARPTCAMSRPPRLPAGPTNRRYRWR